jgi:hypothetical protein
VAGGRFIIILNIQEKAGMAAQCRTVKTAIFRKICCIIQLSPKESMQ